MAEKLKIGRFRITNDLLVSALSFPKDATIIDIRPTDYVGEIEIKVMSDDFHGTEQGEMIIAVAPTLQTTILYCGCRKVEWSWNA